MRFSGQLIQGVLLQRYKRFFVDVQLQDGSVVVAHCANPGSMKSCLKEGCKVWLSPADNPKRKLRFTWELIELDGSRVFVNPARANDIVAEGLKQGIVRELAQYSLLRREVTYGESRFDFLLSGPGKCYVEVKNVTLDMGNGRSAFPDSVTKRGTKHLQHLAELAKAGERAVMLFCASREDATSVEPADAIDPEYGRALRAALDSGVELLAYRVNITLDEVRLQTRIPVRVP